MLVSVVIPVLNEEYYLPELLGDLEKQNHKLFEVIVVDGGSDDKTVSVARSFEKKLEINIVKSKLRNVSVQRNLGAEHAKGKYIIFLDADVRIGSEFLYTIKHVMNKKKHKLFTTWLKPDSDLLHDQILVAVANVGMYVAAKMFEKPFAGGFNIIIKKNLFDKIGGFNTEVALSEDHDLVQRCAEKGVLMQVLKKPRLTISLRRFRDFGYLAILKLYARSFVFAALKKPITAALVEYPMGGHLYVKNKSQLSVLNQLEEFLLKKVKKFVKTLK